MRPRQLVQLGLSVLLDKGTVCDPMDNTPVFAIISPFVENNPTKNGDVGIRFHVQFSAERSLIMEPTEFKKYWIVKSSPLNACRYVILCTIPQSDFSSFDAYPLKTALIRHYALLKQKTSTSNSYLLENLLANILTTETLEESVRHKEYWMRSFIAMEAVGERVMNRFFFADCLRYASMKSWIKADRTIKAYEEAGRTWQDFQFLIEHGNERLLKVELIEGYEELLSKEVKAINYYYNELIQ